jgi:hypothetical protein
LNLPWGPKLTPQKKALSDAVVLMAKRNADRLFGQGESFRFHPTDPSYELLALGCPNRFIPPSVFSADSLLSFCNFVPLLLGSATSLRSKF